MTMNCVPGSSKEVSVEKKTNEFIPDLKNLNQAQLLELLDRQNKLINSRALLHLKDKGEKVKLLKKQIEEELDKRKEAKDICDELTKLSITEKKVEVIEWADKANGCEEKKSYDGILEDGKDPLILLATHSGTTQHKKAVIVEEPEEPLVTLADIEEAYALSLCNKIDKTTPKKEKFLPHKTLISKIDTSKKAKVRDITAATPPPPVFGDAKLITLEESLKLQYEQTKHLKEVQLRHASERLRYSKIRMGSILPTGDDVTTYREHNSPSESDEEIDNENNPGDE